ncbi:MAG: hypothetical protein ACXAB7_20495 [Candidatus Kariarchaeaceae archaeon]
MVTPFDPLGWDYENYRVPVANGLVSGKGLYSEIDYNQMPVYPYLSAFMLLLVGTQHASLMAIAIKFPQVVVDSLIPVMLYQLGKALNQKKAGWNSSLIYTFNPYSIYEIANASFHSIAALLTLITIYCLLQQRPYLVGISIYQLRDIFIATTSFVICTFSILAMVLLPYGTSLKEMYTDLRAHPIYGPEGYQNTTRDVISGLTFITNLQFSLWSRIWFILFVLFLVIPLFLFLKNPRLIGIVDVVTIQLALLSIFFISNHTKHTLWLLPWVFFWAFMHGGMVRSIPFVILIGYFLRRMQGVLPRKYLIGDIVLGIGGIWIIFSIITILNTRREINSLPPEE